MACTAAQAAKNTCPETDPPEPCIKDTQTDEAQSPRIPYFEHCSHHHPQPIRPPRNFFTFTLPNTSRIRLSVSGPLNLSISPKHAAAGDLRTLPSVAPPGAAARLNRPPAQIPASADITTPRRLRWQPVPATTAAAAGRCARRPQRVRAIRQLHERPGGATRIAVWSNRIPAGTGIH